MRTRLQEWRIAPAWLGSHRGAEPAVPFSSAEPMCVVSAHAASGRLSLAGLGRAPACSMLQDLRWQAAAGALRAQASPLDAECESEGKVVCHQGHIKGQPGAPRARARPAPVRAHRLGRPPRDLEGRRLQPRLSGERNTRRSRLSRSVGFHPEQGSAPRRAATAACVLRSSPAQRAAPLRACMRRRAHGRRTRGRSGRIALFQPYPDLRARRQAWRWTTWCTSAPRSRARWTSRAWTACSTRPRRPRRPWRRRGRCSRASWSSWMRRAAAAHPRACSGAWPCPAGPMRVGARAGQARASDRGCNGSTGITATALPALGERARYRGQNTARARGGACGSSSGYISAKHGGVQPCRVNGLSGCPSAGMHARSQGDHGCI